MPLSSIQDLRAEAFEAMEQADRGNYEPIRSGAGEPGAELRRINLEVPLDKRLMDQP
jgi:hypothetical protein